MWNKDHAATGEYDERRTVSSLSVTQTEDSADAGGGGIGESLHSSNSTGDRSGDDEDGIASRHLSDVEETTVGERTVEEIVVHSSSSTTLGREREGEADSVSELANERRARSVHRSGVVNETTGIEEAVEEIPASSSSSSSFAGDDILGVGMDSDGNGATPTKLSAAEAAAALLSTPPPSYRRPSSAPAGGSAEKTTNNVDTRYGGRRPFSPFSARRSRRLQAAEANNVANSNANNDAEEEQYSLGPCRKVSVLVRVRPPRADWDGANGTNGPGNKQPPGSVRKLSKKAEAAATNAKGEDESLCVFPLLPAQGPSPPPAITDAMSPISKTLRVASTSASQTDLAVVNPEVFGSHIPAELTMETAKLVSEASGTGTEDWCRRYRFDRVLWPDDSYGGAKRSDKSGASSASSKANRAYRAKSNTALFHLASAIAQDAIGKNESNAVVAAMGERGSGRTYSVFGRAALPRNRRRGSRAASVAPVDGSDPDAVLDKLGLLGIVTSELLSLQRQQRRSAGGFLAPAFIFTFSLLELRHDDSLRDALRGANERELKLKIRQPPDSRGAIVQNLGEMTLDSLEDLQELITDALDTNGGNSRAKPSPPTLRGHLIATLKIYRPGEDTHYGSNMSVGAGSGKGGDKFTLIQLVDLACGVDTDSGGDKESRRAEASARKSLSGLRGILRGLLVQEGAAALAPSSQPQSQSQSLSYRECTLTRLLQRSLDAPRSRAVVLASVCPRRDSHDAALRTLNYVNRLLVKAGSTAQTPFHPSGEADSTPAPRELFAEGEGARPGLDAGKVTDERRALLARMAANSQRTLLRSMVSDPRQRIASLLKGDGGPGHGQGQGQILGQRPSSAGPAFSSPSPAQPLPAASGGASSGGASSGGAEQRNVFGTVGQGGGTFDNVLNKLDALEGSSPNIHPISQIAEEAGDVSFESLVSQEDAGVGALPLKESALAPAPSDPPPAPRQPSPASDAKERIKSLQDQLDENQRALRHVRKKEKESFNLKVIAENEAAGLRGVVQRQASEQQPQTPAAAAAIAETIAPAREKALVNELNSLRSFSNLSASKVHQLRQQLSEIEAEKEMATVQRTASDASNAELQRQLEFLQNQLRQAGGTGEQVAETAKLQKRVTDLLTERRDAHDDSAVMEKNLADDVLAAKANAAAREQKLTGDAAKLASDAAVRENKYADDVAGIKCKAEAREKKLAYDAEEAVLREKKAVVNNDELQTRIETLKGEVEAATNAKVLAEEELSRSKSQSATSGSSLSQKSSASTDDTVELQRRLDKVVSDKVLGDKAAAAREQQSAADLRKEKDDAVVRERKLHADVESEREDAAAREDDLRGRIRDLMQDVNAAMEAKVLAEKNSNDPDSLSTGSSKEVARDVAEMQSKLGKMELDASLAAGDASLLQRKLEADVEKEKSDAGDRETALRDKIEALKQEVGAASFAKANAAIKLAAGATLSSSSGSTCSQEEDSQGRVDEAVQDKSGLVADNRDLRKKLDTLQEEIRPADDTAEEQRSSIAATRERERFMSDKIDDLTFKVEKAAYSKSLVDEELSDLKKAGNSTGTSGEFNLADNNDDSVMERERELQSQKEAILAREKELETKLASFKEEVGSAVDDTKNVPGSSPSGGRITALQKELYDVKLAKKLSNDNASSREKNMQEELAALEAQLETAKEEADKKQQVDMDNALCMEEELNRELELVNIDLNAALTAKDVAEVELENAKKIQSDSDDLDARLKEKEDELVEREKTASNQRAALENLRKREADLLCELNALRSYSNQALVAERNTRDSLLKKVFDMESSSSRSTTSQTMKGLGAGVDVGESPVSESEIKVLNNHLQAQQEKLDEAAYSKLLTNKEHDEATTVLVQQLKSMKGDLDSAVYSKVLAESKYLSSFSSSGSSDDQLFSLRKELYDLKVDTKNDKAAVREEELQNDKDDMSSRLLSMKKTFDTGLESGAVVNKEVPVADALEENLRRELVALQEEVKQAVNAKHVAEAALETNGTSTTSDLASEGISAQLKAKDDLKEAADKKLTEMVRKMEALQASVVTGSSDVQIVAVHEALVDLRTQKKTAEDSAAVREQELEADKESLRVRLKTVQEELDENEYQQIVVAGEHKASIDAAVANEDSLMEKIESLKHDVESTMCAKHVADVKLEQLQSMSASEVSSERHELLLKQKEEAEAQKADADAAVGDLKHKLSVMQEEVTQALYAKHLAETELDNVTKAPSSSSSETQDLAMELQAAKVDAAAKKEQSKNELEQRIHSLQELAAQLQVDKDGAVAAKLEVDDQCAEDRRKFDASSILLLQSIESLQSNAAVSAKAAAESELQKAKTPRGRDTGGLDSTERQLLQSKDELTLLKQQAAVLQAGKELAEEQVRSMRSTKSVKLSSETKDVLLRQIEQLIQEKKLSNNLAATMKRRLDSEKLELQECLDTMRDELSIMSHERDVVRVQESEPPAKTNSLTNSAELLGNEVESKISEDELQGRVDKLCCDLAIMSELKAASDSQAEQEKSTRESLQHSMCVLVEQTNAAMRAKSDSEDELSKVNDGPESQACSSTAGGLAAQLGSQIQLLQTENDALFQQVTMLETTEAEEKGATNASDEVRSSLERERKALENEKANFKQLRRSAEGEMRHAIEAELSQRFKAENEGLRQRAEDENAKAAAAARERDELGKSLESEAAARMAVEAAVDSTGVNSANFNLLSEGQRQDAMHELKEENARLEQLAEEAIAGNESLSLKNSDLMQQLEQLKHTVKEGQTKNKEFQHNIEANRTKAEISLAQAKKEASAIESQLKKRITFSEQAHAERLALHERQLGGLRKENDRITKDLAQANKQKLLKRDVKELMDDIEKTKKELALKDQQLSAASDRIAALTEELAGSSRLSSSLESNLVLTRQEQQEAENAIAVHLDAIGNLKLSLQNNKALEGKHMGDIGMLERRVQLKDEEIDKLLDEKQSRSELIAIMKEQVSELHSEKAKIESSLKTQRKKYEAESAAKRKLDRENTALRSSIKQCEGVMEQMRNEVTELKISADSAVARFEGKRKAVEKDLIGKLTEERRKVEKAVQQLEDANVAILELKNSSEKSKAMPSPQTGRVAKEPSTELITAGGAGDTLFMDLQEENDRLRASIDAMERGAIPGGAGQATDSILSQDVANAFRTERELRQKAEEIAAALARRAKAGFEQRNAEIIDLKTKLAAATSVGRSQDAALVPSAQFKGAPDTSEELERLRPIVANLEYLYEMKDSSFKEMKVERDDAKREARKYKALAGKLHRQLAAIDQQLISSAQEEGADVSRIVGHSLPLTHGIPSYRTPRLNGPQQNRNRSRIHRGNES